MTAKSKFKSKSKSASVSFKSRSKFSFNSSRLSLVRVENCNEDDPLPLRALDLGYLSDTSLRRSPRFTTSPVQVALENVTKNGRKRGFSGTVYDSKFEALHDKRLRKSPRFLSASAQSCEGGSSFKKPSFKMLSHAKGMRRSPRFGDSAHVTANSISRSSSTVSRKQTSKQSSDSVSPRLSSYQDQTSKSQSFPSSMGEEVEVSDVERCEEFSFRRSPRLIINQPSSKFSPFRSSYQNGCSQNLRTAQNGFINMSSVKMLTAELKKKELEVKTLNFSWHQNSQETHKALNCRSIFPFHRDFDVGAKGGLERSLKLEKNNLEVNLLNGRETQTLSFSLDDNEEPKPFRCNSSFLVEKLLRRSPRFLASENNVDISFLRKFGLKISERKQLGSIPRLISTWDRADNNNSNSNRLKLLELSSKATCIVNKASDVFNSGKLEDKFSGHFSRPHLSSLGVDCDKLTSSSNDILESEIKQSQQKTKISISSVKIQKKYKHNYFFIGDPIPPCEAEDRWNWRYKMKNKSLCHRKMVDDDYDDEIILDVQCHYAQAKVDDCIFNLGDCAYVRGEAGKKHVGKILEFFETSSGENYFRVQWFYKVEDTVIQEEGDFHDKRRLFYSTIMNDNLIDCLISKVNVKQLSPRVGLRRSSSTAFDYYYDMEYCIDYSTFRNLGFDIAFKDKKFAASETVFVKKSENSSVDLPKCEFKEELELLDLYSGCGGMSTGLCLGAKLSSVNLVTRWAVDGDKAACESLMINHPETHVRNEFADNFLELLKEWETLCRRYRVNDAERTIKTRSNDLKTTIQVNEPDGEYEVSSIVDICYGDPNESGKRGLYFKVHWKGYRTSEDTWEPLNNLSNCEDRIEDFIIKGLKSRILPLPGEVDVICGGPPCQGISGSNRFRNIDCPLADERNRQIVVFMDIVKFLKPKYVLMENVTDILRFDKGSLGRYALSRLVSMNYQTRLGTIAAGCYGLPQFRLRVFLWAAHPGEKLPKFPLPTHDVIVRYGPPVEFERNVVGYEEGQPRQLENAVVLYDAISDLPPVTVQETCEEMPYELLPETEFQRYIRSTQYEMTGSSHNDITRTKYPIYDHRPYSLSEDDYLRVCAIPKRKGANFRDLPGVIVGPDNVARRDVENQTPLPSGKLMVPDYAFNLGQGRSKRPFARLWWDETVPTVMTFPSCHNQAALHPEQDRPLTIRECARLQGFPDYYRFCGTVKQRYCQVGNAVAVPVSRALGYCLGLSFRKLGGDESLTTLPPKFSHSNYFQVKESLSLDMD